MKKTSAILVLAAASAAAQFVPPAPKRLPPAAGRGAGQAPARGNPPGAAASSPRDLKYPPLRPIPVPKVESFTLPNGMKLYLLEDHELPVVNGAAWVRTGNLFDPPGKIGLATITGMVLRTGGAEARTSEQLDEQLDNLAARLDSAIGESNGAITFASLKENAGEVLGLFKDMLTGPVFRQDKIDLARSQLRSGIAGRNDEPRGIAQREFANIMYGKDTPFGWLVQYTTLDRITQDDIRGFYKRYFFPKNTMLAVWGDFDTALMKAGIEKLFSDWNVEQPPVPEFPKVRGTPAPGAYLAEKKDIPQTFFSMGQVGVEVKDKDYPALEILSDILNGSLYGQLVGRVRTIIGDVYDMGVRLGARYDHPGLFEISGSTKAFSTVETITAILAEADRIRAAGVTEEELKTAKDKVLNSLAFDYDTKAKTLSRMLNYEYYGYPEDFVQQHQKALAAVTRADVLRVAKERLNPAAFIIVAVGNPQGFGRPLEALGGPAKAIDLTIPEPKLEAAKADEASLAQGKQLLARAQRALGGVDNLAAVKDYIEVADIQMQTSAGSVRVKQTNRWMAPSHYRQDSEVPTGRVSAYTDGKIGWLATAQGWAPLGGPQLKLLRGDLFRLYIPLLLSDRIEGRVVNAIGENTVEISEAGGEIARMEFDGATGLPQRVQYQVTQAKGPPASMEDAYKDFRDVGGVKVPFQVTIRQDGQESADAAVTDFRVNAGLKLPDLEKRP